MKKILFTLLAAAMISACSTPRAKKDALDKNAKGGPAAGESTEAEPLTPGA